MTGLPHPAPLRSLTATWIAISVAAVSLVSAIGILDSASSARAGARELLLAGDFDRYYFVLLDDIVDFRFVETGIVYLALTVLFAALALAARVGPRWAVATTGTLATAGSLIAAWYGLQRFLGDLAIGNWMYDELTSRLKEEAPMWLGFAEDLPIIAAAVGLPWIGILLVVDHFRREPGEPPYGLGAVQRR